MKTLGLLLTIAITLPLGACMERDRCDSHGWCEDNAPVRVCFYESDCGKGYTCQGGSCLARPPVPPPRSDAGAPGDAGGGPVDAGGSRDGGLGGAGGSHPTDGGSSGVGGKVAVDGGSGSGGAGGVRPVDAGNGSGGAVGQPSDGGAAPGCDAGGTGPGCHVHPTPVCQFDNQCGLGGRCLDGECQRPCASVTDCGTGQVCAGGFCGTSTTSGGQCVFNADCGAGKTCINGTCHAGCAADADCATQGQAHDRCVAGICQPDTSPQPQCRANLDCVGVHVTEDVCVDAVCRTPCLSDTDCCVGSSGSVCQMGYCLATQEVAPQCRISGDCGGGKACLDAICGE
jgi:hypothetical protein